MTAGDSFSTYWYFHLPNLLLAAVMYTLMGRLLLSLFFQPGSRAVIWRVFAQITDPFVRVVATVTPRIVPPPLLIVFTIVWCLALRMALLIVLTMYGLAPKPI
jgi:uncharacterized protein YggT (Ycf19 family)